MLRTVVLGTSNLLEATRPLACRCFVHMGSSLEYGPRARPLTETDALQPTTFRGAAKAAAALLCRQAVGGDGAPIVALRPFSVYGYWERGRLVPTAILSALLGRPMSLTTPGYRRDLVFVEDVVEACLRAGEADGAIGETINVGSGQQWSNEEVVEAVQALSGTRIPLSIGAHPASCSDTEHWVADIRKAKEVLGWEPEHTLTQGLEKTVAWFRLNAGLYE